VQARIGVMQNVESGHKKFMNEWAGRAL
jgi:hypothetical protein